MAVGKAADGASPIGAAAAVAVMPPVAPTATGNEKLTLETSRGQVVLASFTAAHFSHHVSNSLLNPLLPFIRDAFRLNYDQTGWLVSAFSLSLGLSNAPIGVLADRFGSRNVIVIGLILTGFVSAAIAYAGSYWQLFGMLIILGLIAGSYHAPASALMSRIFPASVRGSAIGLHTTGGHLSFFIVPATAAWLVTTTGTWTTPYLWLAFAPIVAGLWLWRIAPGHHQRPAGKTDRLAVFRELGVVIKTVGPLVSASMLFQVVFAALQAFTTLYLVDVRGIEPAWAAVLFGVPQLVGLFGSPLGGILSDRIGRRGVILIALSLMGPSLWGIAALPNELILIPLIGAGIAAAMRLTCTEVLVMDSAPAHRRATALGAYHMLVQQTGGLAAPALGILAAAIGLGPAFGGVCAALGLASVAVVVFSRKL